MWAVQCWWVRTGGNEQKVMGQERRSWVDRMLVQGDGGQGREQDMGGGGWGAEGRGWAVESPSRAGTHLSS